MGESSKATDVVDRRHGPFRHGDGCNSRLLDQDQEERMERVKKKKGLGNNCLIISVR